jgi:hypothetical protein
MGRPPEGEQRLVDLDEDRIVRTEHVFPRLWLFALRLIAL